MPNYAEFESIVSDLFIHEIFVPPHPTHSPKEGEPDKPTENLPTFPRIFKIQYLGNEAILGKILQYV